MMNIHIMLTTAVVASSSLLPLFEHLSLLLIGKMATDPKITQDAQELVKELHLIWDAIGPEHQKELEEWLKEKSNRVIGCLNHKNV